MSDVSLRALARAATQGGQTEQAVLLRAQIRAGVEVFVPWHASCPCTKCPNDGRLYETPEPCTECSNTDFRHYKDHRPVWFAAPVHDLAQLKAFMGDPIAREVLPTYVVTDRPTRRESDWAMWDSLPLEEWIPSLLVLGGVLPGVKVSGVACRGPTNTGRCIGKWKWCPKCLAKLSSLSCWCDYSNNRNIASTRPCPCGGAEKQTATVSAERYIAVLIAIEVGRAVFMADDSTHFSTCRICHEGGLCQDREQQVEALISAANWTRCPCHERTEECRVSLAGYPEPDSWWAGVPWIAGGASEPEGTVRCLAAAAAVVGAEAVKKAALEALPGITK